MDKDKIIAYLNNDNSAFDKNEVEKWIERYPDEFKRIKFVWERAGVDTSEEPDLEKAWLRVNQETRNAGGHKSRKLRLLTNKLQRVAAVIVLAISLGAIVYYQYSGVNMTEMAWQEIVNNSNDVKKVLLTDGSEVWLNADAKVRYPVEFKVRKREVYLEGEAFFKVKHNKHKPFMVRTGNTITKVLGTSFNVKGSTQGNVQVTVATGRVSLSSTENKGQKVILQKGDLGIFSEQTNIVEKQRNRDLNFMAWKTGMLTFNKMPLEEVCKVLSAHYKTNVYIGADALTKINLTATYDNKSIEQVLEILKLTLNIQYHTINTGIELLEEK